MSLRDQASSAVRWSTAGGLLANAVQLVQLAVLARLLEPGDFGLMAMVILMIGFASAFSDLGLSAAVIHRQDASREELSSLYWANVAAGFAVFAAIWLITPAAVLFFQE